MPKQRKFYRYELKDSRKVVYRGITNDPQRREQEHSRQGKRFSHMRVVGPVVTRETAEKWEAEGRRPTGDTTEDRIQSIIRSSRRPLHISRSKL